MRGSRFALAVAAAALVGLAIVIAGPILTTLALGWLWYLVAVLPRVHLNLPEIALALGFALGLALGAQALARRVITPVWRWRWTLLGLGLVVTMFATSMASAGVAHHLGWMLRARADLLERPGGPAALLGEACAAVEPTEDGLRLRDAERALELELITPTSTGSALRAVLVPRAAALLRDHGFAVCALDGGSVRPASALAATLRALD
jgi:hypothetical protein